MIENHDWIGANADGLAASAVCRVTMYGHDEAAIGQFEKRLLHGPQEEFRELAEQPSPQARP